MLEYLSADIICSEKRTVFRERRNTHQVSSLLVLVKIHVVASQHKIQRNKSLSRFSGIWKHRTGLKVHALHYANELLVSVRLAVQKLLQTRQTSSRNNKKLSKTGFGLIKHCLGNLWINATPEKRVFLHNFPLQKKRKSFCLQQFN